MTEHEVSLKEFLVEKIERVEKLNDHIHGIIDKGEFITRSVHDALVKRYDNEIKELNRKKDELTGKTGFASIVAIIASLISIISLLKELIK